MQRRKTTHPIAPSTGSGSTLSRRGLLRATAGAALSGDRAPLFAQVSSPVASLEIEGPSLTVSPDVVRLDEPFRILVSGLAPDQEVTISSQFGSYSASAAYIADEQGRVNPSRQRPFVGDFELADPMGFIWAARSPGGWYSVPITIPETVRIEASVDGGEPLVAEVERYIHRRGYGEEYISNEEMVGNFYPPGEGHGTPAPAILVLGGSEGGLSMQMFGSMLAAHGYAVLHLAYFGIGALPMVLERIPLEYFGRGISWLQARSEVDATRVGILGYSRGAELALILGSQYPDITSVVSCAGAGYAFGGYGQDRSASAWTLNGEDYPFVPWEAEYESFGTDLYERYEIPVEKTNGPLLFICGDADALWETTMLSQVAMDRLNRHEHAWPSQLLSYPGAGHLIPPAYTPIDNSGALSDRMGGDLYGTKIASVNSWRATLHHFATSLRYR